MKRFCAVVIAMLVSLQVFGESYPRFKRIGGFIDVRITGVNAKGIKVSHSNGLGYLNEKNLDEDEIAQVKKYYDQYVRKKQAEEARKNAARAKRRSALAKLKAQQTAREDFIKAAAENDLEKVKKLLGTGVNINSKNSRGVTALMNAANAGNVEIVEYLTTRGADVNIRSVAGKTALMYAAENNKPKVIPVLLKARTAPKSADNSTIIALMYAASDGYVEVVEAMLKNRVNVNIRDNSGMTALAYAVLHNEVEMVKMLLERGANADARNHLGMTPLMYATRHYSGEVFTLLMSEKKSPKKKAPQAAVPSLAADAQAVPPPADGAAPVDAQQPIADGGENTPPPPDGENPPPAPAGDEAPEDVPSDEKKNKVYYANHYLTDNNGWSALIYAVIYRNIDVVRIWLAQDLIRNSENKNDEARAKAITKAIYFAEETGGRASIASVLKAALRGMNKEYKKEDARKEVYDSVTYANIPQEIREITTLEDLAKSKEFPGVENILWARSPKGWAPDLLHGLGTVDEDTGAGRGGCVQFQNLPTEGGYGKLVILPLISNEGKNIAIYENEYRIGKELEAFNKGATSESSGNASGDDSSDNKRGNSVDSNVSRTRISYVWRDNRWLNERGVNTHGVTDGQELYRAVAMAYEKRVQGVVDIYQYLSRRVNNRKVTEIARDNYMSGFLAKGWYIAMFSQGKRLYYAVFPVDRGNVIVNFKEMYFIKKIR
ncbi:MAG: ankyrin repeat domain-containing protein [Lentisphaeria bacterium]|nr:ankyrin repeat domain-containing protein [Lentisphaeria bacterium]